MIMASAAVALSASAQSASAQSAPVVKVGLPLNVADLDRSVAACTDFYAYRERWMAEEQSHSPAILDVWKLQRADRTK